VKLNCCASKRRLYMVNQEDLATSGSSMSVS
jgi:hypothetical protein